MGDYYRIVPDERDLNYGKYFTEGEEQISRLDDYNSHNTQRLTVSEIKEKLLQLEFIQQELRGGVGCAY
jgi:UDP-glucose 4-epimerase